MTLITKSEIKGLLDRVQALLAKHTFEGHYYTRFPLARLESELTGLQYIMEKYDLPEIHD